MTAPPTMMERLLAPRVLVPLVLAVLVLTALLSPRATADAPPRLTSYSADPNGARGLHDVAGRLGWQVDRRTTPFDSALDPRATYLVLDAPIEMTGSEVGRLLAAVRAGAGLLLVPTRGSALSDSLQIRRSPGGMVPLPDSLAAARARPAGCQQSLGEQSRGARFVMHTLLTGPALRGSRTVFLGARASRNASDGAAVILGTTLGRGRVVTLADPYLLRNDVIRLCTSDAGVRAVRLLEWLTPAGSDAASTRRLVFDEFHQGYGRQPSVWRSVRRALTATAPGRTLLHALVAALVLLAATGARALAPVERRMLERRSPIEHVGALARAYEQARASRVAARRLVRGLRRRHAVGRGGGDEAFLARVAERHPARAADVSLIAGALARPVPPSEFVRVGEAVARVERALDDVLGLSHPPIHPPTHPPAIR